MLLPRVIIHDPPSAHIESRLRPKVKFYFEDLLLRGANLFLEIIGFCSEIFSTVTQLGVVFHLSRSDYGGPIFGALCVSQPLLNLMNGRHLWGKGHYELLDM